MNKMHRMHDTRFIIICLITLTLIVYWPVSQHEFVNYDDSLFVSGNPHIRDGFTWEGLQWAFSTGLVTNYHREFWIPVTYISHMLTIELFGMDPSGHHLINVGFHIANVVVLFLLLRRLTGALWCSALVAALFAVHPLHVESVAWVTERKDVLSTLFWLLTLWAYVRYTEHRSLHRYLLVVLALVLGLMAKPMLVTLPLVLLLLDYWPLGRVTLGGLDKRTRFAVGWKLVWEKLPLFVLVASFSVLTYFVQGQWGQERAVEWFPFWVRAENALVSYVSYIGKMFWPRGLAVFYPHPGRTLPLWQVVGAVVVLVSVSLLVIRVRQSRPYLVVGWLWYLVTLVPVIGFIQIGGQALADRFTYVPLIGVFIMMVWGIDGLTAGWSSRRVVLACSAGLIILVLSLATRIQVGYWRNSLTLSERALRVTSNNGFAHNNLGTELKNLGRDDEAVTHFREALLIWPHHLAARFNLALTLAHQDQLNAAIWHFSQVLQVKPDDVEAHYNIGVAYARQGQTEQARAHFSEALRIDPGYNPAQSSLSTLPRK